MLNFLRDLRHHVKVSLLGSVRVLITEFLGRSRDYGGTRPQSLDDCHLLLIVET